MVWCLGALMIYVDQQHVVFWNRVMVGGLITVPLAFSGTLRAFLHIPVRKWLTQLAWVAFLGVQTLNVLGYMTKYISVTADGRIHFEFGAALPLLGLYFFGLVGSVAWSAGRIYRHSTDPIHRNRIFYAFIGIGVSVVLGFSNLIPPLSAYPIDIAGNIANALLLAYAIYRYQLLDIRLVVRKGLLYAIPTATIGAAYFFIIALVVNLQQFVFGYEVLLLSFVLAIVTALLVEPLRNQLQAIVDRAFFREKYDSSLMLQRLSRTTNSVLDLDVLTGMILDDVLGTLHIASGAFCSVRPRPACICLGRRAGLTRLADRGLKLAPEHPVIGWLAREQTSLARQTIESAPEFRGMWGRERQELELLNSELIVPLSTRRTLIGILILGPKLSEISYTVDERLTLTTLAYQTASAVENARLFSLEQQKARELAALLAVAQAISSTWDLPTMLRLVARRAAEACGFDRCSVALTAVTGPAPALFVSQQVGGQGLDQRASDEAALRVLLAEPWLSKRLLEKREPAVFGDEWVAFRPSNQAGVADIKGVLVVPLVSKDQFIGLMCLDSFTAGRRITQAQVDLAATIAGQVAIAIENAALYRRTIEEKERTATIVQQALAGLLLLDAERRVVMLNPAAEAVIGLSAHEASGRLLTDVLGAHFCDRERSLCAAIADGLPVSPIETEVARSGRSRIVLMGGTPLSSGYLLSFADITRLKEVDRLKSTVIANVSHEFRTPLAVIKSHAEFLQEGLEAGDEELRRRFLAIIDQQTDRLTRMVSDLTDIACLEAGQVRPDSQPVNIGSVIAEAVSTLELQARERQVTIQRDVPLDLPTLRAIRPLMATAVRNLLENAIGASPANATVQVSAWAENGNLVVQVLDQGRQLTAIELANLFEQFHSASSGGASRVGVPSLGLVVVRQAAEAHHGSVRAEVAPSAGTLFTLTLPRTVMDE